MQPSDNEEAKWRAEFEKLGRETVRTAIYRARASRLTGSVNLLSYGFE